jgi:hypothetical protein
MKMIPRITLRCIRATLTFHVLLTLADRRFMTQIKNFQNLPSVLCGPSGGNQVIKRFEKPGASCDARDP